MKKIGSGSSEKTTGPKSAIFPILILFLLTTVPLYVYDSSRFPFLYKPFYRNITGNYSSTLHDHQLQAFETKTTTTTINGSSNASDHVQEIPLSPSPPINVSTIPLNSTPSSFQSPKLQALESNISNSSPAANKTEPPTSLSSDEIKRCNIFKGDWVFSDSKEPYYTNETKCVIDDRQNCMKFGRPDTDFLKWRWKPYGCDLPLFDARRFLEIVKGKTLAFLGDSVGRNQMQSLVCLLSSAAQPVDVSYTSDTRYQRWLYKDYNFTIAAFWSPVLVNSSEASTQQNKYLMNLYLDQPDESWSSQVEKVDILIVSGGQWFFRPFVYYNRRKIVGCHLCNDKKIKEREVYHGYRMAFRTTLRTLVRLKNYKGLTFLRTFSPAHFENGEWNTGGDCRRRLPFTKKEKKVDWMNLDMYKIQLREFRDAERKGRKRGLKFRMLDTTEAMILRGDGHPSNYGHWPTQNKTVADCVHWCMPGPVDSWNEFLFQMLKMEEI
ncbi:protein trichome birefringence-like 19 [Impatiens glandulifera]|uniref:protein trichome birefringence-like 19 n=1 Tax=Impatiens glandulifera TaxID=253017 RepID=UPI001FB17A35|nr:protein trichome birefringence-like 19 [Impatiens glandulifera]